MSFNQGHALLIGVGSHKFEPKLDVPITVADAQSMANVLQDDRFCGYLQEKITLLHDETATTDGILGALAELGERTRVDDTVLIFYSGHGEYGADGNYYLISHDARIDNRKVVSGTGVSQAALLDKLSGIRAGRVLMIFNACHSGEISPTLGIEDELGAKSLPNTAAGALLATGSGRIIITACREGQYSYIGDGQVTLFVQALVDSLQGKDVLPRGGYISAFNLYTAVYDMVSETVSQRYNRQQEPELTVLKGVGPFAVALFRGATDTNLSVAEEQVELPEYTAVRRVKEEKAQHLLQQFSGVQIGSISDVHGSQINIAGGDVITTGGAAFVAGGVDTSGGDFVGRDKVVRGDEVHGDKVGGDKIEAHISGSTGVAIGRGAQARVTQGLGGRELEALFQSIMEAVQQAPAQDQPQALQMAEDLKQEAARGENADDGHLASLLNGFIELVPGAVSAVVSAFASPVLAGVAGPVTKMVLDKIQGK